MTKGKVLESGSSLGDRIKSIPETFKGWVSGLSDYISGNVREALVTGTALTCLAFGSGCGAMNTVRKDVGQYGDYARQQSSRDYRENFGQAGEELGGAGENLVNVFSAGQAFPHESGALRENDGRGFGKGFVHFMSRALGNLGEGGKDLIFGVYSIPDTIDDASGLKIMPPLSDNYRKTASGMRSMRYASGLVLNPLEAAFKDVPNAFSDGHADNVTGSAFNAFKKGVETGKYGIQGTGNLAIREPIRLFPGETPEGIEKALDWPLLVSSENVSNVLQLEGLGNMKDYQSYREAISEKGHFGTGLEFGESALIAYLLSRRGDSGGDGSAVKKSESGPGKTPSDPGNIFF